MAQLDSIRLKKLALFCQNPILFHIFFCILCVMPRSRLERETDFGVIVMSRCISSGRELAAGERAPLIAVDGEEHG